MSDKLDNRPGDVWINVAGTSEGVSPKYFAAFASNPQFGTVEIRLNLTAYVRDMIAEAMK